MKSLLYILCITSLTTYSIFCQVPKEYTFPKSKVKIYENETGTFINILNERKEVYSKLLGKDGFCSNIDTLSLNNDGILDYLYIYSYDDSFDVGFFVSDKKKFYTIDLGQFLPASDTCMPNYIYHRYFIEFKYLYINAFLNAKYKFVNSNCSQRFKLAEILNR